jgi:transposase
MYVSYESSYGDIPQKWILFQSAERQKQSEKKFLSNVQKKLKEHQISLKKLCSKGYACERDAYMIIERWHAKHPRYFIEKMDVTHSKQKVSGGRGRPRKDEPLVDVYRIPCKIRLNEEIIAKELEQLGRFILASNDCDIEPETMLDYYKEQNVAERGFKFLKDKTFHAAEIYLKNEDRVAALSMIMVVCLLVYTVAEWLFRNILKKNNTTVRNQMNKPTDRPTMKRVFYLFRRVRQILEISDDGPVCRILNFNKELPPILRLLGPRFEKYYA